MQRQHGKRWPAILCLIGVMALLAACGGGGQPAAATQAAPTEAPQPTATTPPPTAAPTATTAAAAPSDEGGSEEAPAGEETPEAAATEEGATQNVFEVAGINSYRSQTTISVEGPAFEDEEFQSLEITGEYVKEPPAQHIMMGIGEGQNVEVIQIGDQSWVNYAGQWISSSGQSIPDFTASFAPFDLADVEDNLGQMQRVGTETVNGIDATHYTYDKATLLNLLDQEVDRQDIEKVEVAEGDIYVADQGFIVKWSVHVEGTGVNEEKPDAAGSMTIEYELYDFNEDIEITAPETPSASESLGFELPEPEGAVQIVSSAGLVIYSVPGMSVQDAADFYTEALGAAGFEQDEATSTVSEDGAFLSFSGNGMTVNIAIQPGTDGVEITVSATG